MSLKEVERIKKNKYFKSWDLLVYFLLLLIVVAVFLFFFFLEDKDKKPDYLEIRYQNNLIGVYDFDKNTLTAEEGNEKLFKIEESSATVFIYVYLSEEEYNVLEINKTDRLVGMHDANCSQRKDCTYMYIRQAGQSIVCVPHNLAVEGVSKDGEADGIIIG